MIREFVQSVDDREWQTSLFSLLQSQSYNQCEVDLFELMCKVLDQNLFSQVDWARNTIFFKDLKVCTVLYFLFVVNDWETMDTSFGKFSEVLLERYCIPLRCHY